MEVFKIIIIENTILSFNYSEKCPGNDKLCGPYYWGKDRLIL